MQNAGNGLEGLLVADPGRILQVWQINWREVLMSLTTEI